MGKLNWYKRDPDAALGGMMGLTLEERGAYNTVLDLIYSHADRLPDDDRFLAGWCNCDVRVWRRLKERLIELGKLHIEGGFVRNARATSGVDEALTRIEKASGAARARWDDEPTSGGTSGLSRGGSRPEVPEMEPPKSQQDVRENNDLAHAPASKTHMTATTTTTISNTESVTSSRGASARPPAGPRSKLGEDWEPGPELRQWAIDTIAATNAAADLGREVLKFRRYWKDTSKSDRGWKRAFENWIWKAIEWSERDAEKSQGAGRPTRRTAAANRAAFAASFSGAGAGGPDTEGKDN